LLKVNLRERIEEILANVYSTGHNQIQAAYEYNESFQNEGLRKSQFVVDRIEELDGKIHNELKDFTALSVGGSDGSDLLALVKNTPVRRTILLEYDNAAAQLATKYTEPLIKQEGGELKVIIGDAFQQLETIVALLDDERRDGAKGLLCVFFGVLHELPRRSSGFELRQYISRLSSVFDRNLFFLSEPCLPPHTEEEIEVRVADIGEARLFELLNHINAHLFGKKQSNNMLSNGFVRAGFPLVMEMLHKLLRFETIPRLQHEMKERLTEFTSDQFVQAFRIALPGSFIERTERVSEGFQRAFLSVDVELRTLNGQAMVLPFSHVRVSAISLPPIQKPFKQELSQEFRYADSSLADVDFPIPFNHPVTEIVLALRSHDWYRQSPAIEKIFTTLNWKERTPDEAFVLGRNVYQCADGEEKRAKNIVNNLRRELAKIPDDLGVHVLIGMFYEVYFDSEGKFRGHDLKDTHLAKLFSLEKSKKFKGCIDFIRAALEPFRDCLGVLPNTTPECLVVNVKLNLSENPPMVESIKCNGTEQMIPRRDHDEDPADGLSDRPFQLETFGVRLGKFWRIPDDHIDVRFDTNVSEIKIVQIRPGKTVRRLQM